MSYVLELYLSLSLPLPARSNVQEETYNTSLARVASVCPALLERTTTTTYYIAWSEKFGGLQKG